MNCPIINIYAGNRPGCLLSSRRIPGFPPPPCHPGGYRDLNEIIMLKIEKFLIYAIISNL